MDGQAVTTVFGQDGAADVLPPGLLLAELTAEAASSPGSLSDDELVGVLHAARRLANHAGWQQTVVIAEFARRRQAAFEAAKAAGIPVGCRDGEFPGEELAMELVTTRGDAGARIDAAVELATRLPATLAAMEAGAVDPARAAAIAFHTSGMSDADAAYADEVLAAAAPDKRPDQLARKAAALELKLAPEAVAARKVIARQDQRVEARREESGNAALSGRELDTADVIASKAYIDAIAVRLRESGVGGTLPALRALALVDLTQGRNPLDRITSRVVATPEAAASDNGSATGPEPADSPKPGGQAGPAPVPALINLLVPAGTLLGWGTAPGQAAGQHPWPGNRPPPPGSPPPPESPPRTRPRPGAPPPRAPQTPGTTQTAQLLDLLRRLNIRPEPIARGTCDHRNAENRYTPSRKLKHLVRARNKTCTAPGCNAQAVYCDLDHTVPYPDGPTDQCNLTPKCRHHHRTKQAPGWKVTQPTPDTTAWTTPSGRVHTTTATAYDL